MDEDICVLGGPQFLTVYSFLTATAQPTGEISVFPVGFVQPTGNISNPVGFYSTVRNK